MTPRLIVALVAMVCATALAVTLLIVNDDDQPRTRFCYVNASMEPC